jgi:hypothetical protein
VTTTCIGIAVQVASVPKAKAKATTKAKPLGLKAQGRTKECDVGIAEEDKLLRNFQVGCAKCI